MPRNVAVIHIISQSVVSIDRPLAEPSKQACDYTHVIAKLFCVGWEQVYNPPLLMVQEVWERRKGDTIRLF